MTSHLVGEFRPPREIAAMGAARVTGVGTVDALREGLVVEGRMLSAPPVPRVAFGLGFLAAVLVGAMVPGGDLVAVPALLALGAAVAWVAWRTEIGVHGRHVVPWPSVEHVVRLPSDHDVVAIVLAGPVAGAGTPEQVYFAPSLGVEALAAALREHVPGLTVDLESALVERPPEPDEAS